jgi:hypothetical protein
MMKALPFAMSRLMRDCSGVAAVEWALSAPLVLTMFLNGAELTNYAIAKMRVSQIALHVADNASRIGTDSLLTAPQISETQINDLLLGANLQGGGLDLQNHGRVIVSSLEPIAPPTNPTGKFKVHWQRCYGAKVFPSSYGDQGNTNLTHFGPVGKQVSAVPETGGVIYVEVAYDYQPLISAKLVPSGMMHDVATMVVRDDRDYVGPTGSTTGIYNNEGVTGSSCT